MTDKMKYLRFFDGPVELDSTGIYDVTISACCYVDNCKVTISFDKPRILAVNAYLLQNDKLDAFINECWEHFKSSITNNIGSDVVIEQREFATFRDLLKHSLFMLKPTIREQLL